MNKGFPLAFPGESLGDLGVFEVKPSDVCPRLQCEDNDDCGFRSQPGTGLAWLFAAHRGLPQHLS